METCISDSSSTDCPPAGAESRSIEMSAFPDSNMLESQGPLTSFLRPISGIIEPPSEDHAAAMDRAVEPPPLILRIEPDGSTPMCLQAETKPTPSVLAPFQTPFVLISWLIALTPTGPCTPNLECGECFRGAVQESQRSPSNIPTFE